MNISFELPPNIEQEISANGADLSGEAREAYLVELYRQDRITHHQLAEAMGLSRLETEGILKRHEVSSGVTAEEMRAQAAALREGLAEEARRIILLQGPMRFGAADEEVKAKVDEIHDLEHLEAMIKRILIASSWDELFAQNCDCWPTGPSSVPRRRRR